MDALVTVHSCNTNELEFGHGCSGHRILLEHEGIRVWHGCSSHCILLKRTKLWFGHGCSSRRILLEHERNYGLSLDAPVTLFFWNTNGVRNYGLGMAPVTVFLPNTNRIMVWTKCSSHRILLNGIMVGAMIFEFPYSLGTRTEWLRHGCPSHRVLFGHACSGHRILVETNGIMVWTGCSSHCILLKRTELWFGHACSSDRILLEHKRNYSLGMDALVTVGCFLQRGRVETLYGI